MLVVGPRAAVAHDDGVALVGLARAADAAVCVGDAGMQECTSALGQDGMGDGTRRDTEYRKDSGAPSSSPPLASPLPSPTTRPSPPPLPPAPWTPLEITYSPARRAGCGDGRLRSRRRRGRGAACATSSRRSPCSRSRGGCERRASPPTRPAVSALPPSRPPRAPRRAPRPSVLAQGVGPPRPAAPVDGRRRSAVAAPLGVLLDEPLVQRLCTAAAAAAAAVAGIAAAAVTDICRRHLRACAAAAACLLLLLLTFRGENACERPEGARRARTGKNAKGGRRACDGKGRSAH